MHHGATLQLALPDESALLEGHFTLVFEPERIEIPAAGKVTVGVTWRARE